MYVLYVIMTLWNMYVLLYMIMTLWNMYVCIIYDYDIMKYACYYVIARSLVNQSGACDTGSWCGWHLDHGALTGKSEF
jgi:hypothetical protein